MGRSRKASSCRSPFHVQIQDFGTRSTLMLLSCPQSSADLGVKSPPATSPQRARPPDNMPHPQYPDLQHNLGGPPPPAAGSKGVAGSHDYPEIRGNDNNAPNFQPMSSQLPGSGTSPTKPQAPGPPKYRQVHHLRGSCSGKACKQSFRIPLHRNIWL